jgi:hypothetical protein
MVKGTLDAIWERVKDDVNVFPPPKTFPTPVLSNILGGGFIIGLDIGLFFSVRESVK